MIKNAKFTAIEAGTATIEKRKVTIRMSRKALSEAYAVMKKEAKKLPMSMTAFLERARDEASDAVTQDRKKKPRPTVFLRWKLVIITGYIYLDGVLVMTVNAVVVRHEDPV